MKKVLSIIITFLLIFSISTCIPVSAFQISGFELNAKGALLVNTDTDEIIYSKNADQKMYPASLTKMLVAVVVLENTADLDAEIITMTVSVRNQIWGTGASTTGLVVGEEITARQALHALLISSGGDVAYAIAEHYGGTTEGFMQKMNETAQKIGMAHSHFGNPVGLHDEQTYTTPSDIYLLAKYATRFEVFNDITSKARYTLPATNKSKERILSTTNFLIDPATNYYYKYASGIKTGFTDEAGRCVVSKAGLDGYNYICIIMNCDSKGGRRNEFLDSANLYRWAFKNFEYKSVLDINNPVGEIPVELSTATDHLQLYPENSLTKILPKDADQSTINLKINLNQSSVEAPVKVGTVFGTADIIYAGEVIGTVNLVNREAAEANFFLRVGKVIKTAVTSTVFKVIIGIIAAVIIIYIIICIMLNVKSHKRRKVKYKPYNKHDKE